MRTKGERIERVRPLDRGAITGRYTNVIEQEMRHERKELANEQQEAIEKYPERAAVVDIFLGSIQFDVVRDMYREINARSRGPDKKIDTANKLHERSRTVGTNEINREDIFLVNEEGTMAAEYRTRSNTISINLDHNLLLKIIEKDSQSRPLDGKDQDYFKEKVFQSFLIIFHELSHAYSYNLDNVTLDANGTTFKVASHSGVNVRKGLIPKDTSIKEKWESDFYYWLEGFNELQSFFIMKDYLATGHSLTFKDISLQRDEMWGLFYDSLQLNKYGPAVHATDSIIDFIARKNNLPYAVVSDSFLKAFQTKEGAQHLLPVLRELFGVTLTNRIRWTHEMSPDSDNLSRIIMERMEASPEMMEELEEIIDDPDRWDRFS